MMPYFFVPFTRECAESVCLGADPVLTLIVHVIRFSNGLVAKKMLLFKEKFSKNGGVSHLHSTLIQIFFLNFFFIHFSS